MPAAAFNLTPLDHQLLAMSDDEFIPHDWNDLQDIIGECIPSFSKDSPLMEYQHGMISEL